VVESTVSAMLANAMKRGNMVAEVAPGASIETEVVFDVPKGTDLESIWLRGGPLSDGVAVAL
jgi:hypothetical protein